MVPTPYNSQIRKFNVFLLNGVFGRDSRAGREKGKCLRNGWEKVSFWL